jgi:hypothetical protein
MNSKFDPLTQFHYEEKAIAFLDILGWRKLVEDSVRDDALRQRMTINIDMIRNMTYANQDGRQNRPALTPTQIIQFSDSVVISSDPSIEGVQMLLFQVQFLISSFLLSGFLVRGGITKGKLLHKDSLIFGPSLNRAYDLESKYAVYPRVLIDPIHIDFFSNILGKNDLIKILDFTSHNDNASFVNVLKPHPSRIKGDAFDMASVHRMISQLIETEKNYHMKPKELAKINWFISYYNTSLDRYPDAEGYNGKLPKLPLFNKLKNFTYYYMFKFARKLKIKPQA